MDEGSARPSRQPRRRESSQGVREPLGKSVGAPEGATLPAGYKIKEDTVEAAPGLNMRTGKFSFEDATGRKHYVGGSERVATNRANAHATQTAQAAATQKQALRDRVEAAHAQATSENDFRDQLRKPLPKIDQAANAEAVQTGELRTAMHHPGNGVRTNEAKLQQIIDSPSSGPDDRSYAQNLLDDRGYETAKGRLAGRTNEQLSELAPSIATSEIKPHEKRGAAKYIEERLGKA